jgi:hypothetical protein
MTKHAGKYYLQYSAPGTEFKTYAVGVYVGDSPLGPFKYEESSPILRGTGFLNGTGHHAVIEGPDGQLWVMYHVLLNNENKWERRLALDRVEFDQAGNMTMTGPTDVPQWGPAVGRKGSAGLLNLSTDGKYAASSAAPGHAAEQAFDQNVRTWWEPAASEAGAWLSVDLGTARQVAAARILFYHAAPFQYRIEASRDGTQWKAVAENTDSALADCNRFDVFAPVEARYVRLTITGKPAATPIRVIELTAFGANGH